MQLGNFIYTGVKGVAYIQNVSLHSDQGLKGNARSAPHVAININEFFFFLNFK
jgi:hypothetical protein